MNTTPGERFLISRRRAHITQHDIAEVYEVSPHRVAQWEWDRRSDVPSVTLDPPVQPHERCYIWRRRVGWTLEELEKRTDLHVSWLHRAERGELRDMRALLVWWMQVGSAFLPAEVEP